MAAPKRSIVAGSAGWKPDELDCDAPCERIETGERSLGAIGRVLADLERRAVVRLQHEQPIGARVDVLDEVEEVREVAERLRHLLAAHLDPAVVDPVRRELTTERDGLRALVLVVREREVAAAAMEVEPLAEEVE